MRSSSLEQHNTEIHLNQASWDEKPLLRSIYRDFYRRIADAALPPSAGLVVELGSGIGGIRDVLPHCIRTDLFQNPHIDQVENAYALSFKDQTVGTLILFDVFHHLQYPGAAFREFERVLVPGGRVIIFDPCVSLLGLLVYGALHHEPLGLRAPITWDPRTTWKPDEHSYYAAQGNAYRVFFGSERHHITDAWEVVSRARLSALSYVLSGGYSRPQMYPSSLYPVMRLVDRVLDGAPLVFATRLMVVLQRRRPR